MKFNLNMMMLVLNKKNKLFLNRFRGSGELSAQISQILHFLLRNLLLKCLWLICQLYKN